MYKLGLLLLILINFITSNCFAKGLRCKNNATITSKCYFVHGTLNMSADAGYVIWLKAPNTEIDVRPATVGDSGIPSEIGDVFRKNIYAQVEGDFEVCPIAKQQFPIFANRFGCIESMSNVKITTLQSEEETK